MSEENEQEIAADSGDVEDAGSDTNDVVSDEASDEATQIVSERKVPQPTNMRGKRWE